MTEELNVEINEALFQNDLIYDWIKSYKCYLSPKEKQLIVYYILFGKNESQTEIKKLLNKLKTSMYREWVGEKTLIDSGIIEAPTEIEIFLTAYFSYHPISTRLYNSLQKTNCKNFFELIIRYSIDELLEIFDSKSRNELIEYLYKHNYLHKFRNEKDN